MKQKVEKKLLHICSGEFVSLLIFAFIWMNFVPQFHGATDYYIANTLAFLLLEWILLQGSLYWYLKWRRIKKGMDVRLSRNERRLFQIGKWINLLLFPFVALVFLYELQQTGNMLYFIAIYGFALIEYINYYHIRLSYMQPEEIKEFRRQKGFRKSILARELERGH